MAAQPGRPSPLADAFRRLMDIASAALALTLLSIPMLFIAWRIRRDSPGPAIFRQTRAGRDLQPFTLLKFRTMRTDADPYGSSPHAADDPRLTPFGRKLREWSLDELPQLWNVLCGDMTLVGPRPLYVEQARQWTDRQRLRLLVKPGLTGLAQISGRGAITIEQKLELDAYYVEHRSLLGDLGIIIRTIFGMHGRGGIYEQKYSEKEEFRSK